MPQACVINITGHCTSADFVFSVVRVVYFNGSIFTLVGNGSVGVGPDSGPGTSILLRASRGIVSDGNAGFVVADTLNGCLRSWFAANSSVATLAGKVGVSSS